MGAPPLNQLETSGIRGLDALDLAAAQRFTATIKPIVWAARTPAGLDAFVGPALVPLRHPLASLAGTLTGIQLSGRYVNDLFFSGPGAGPDVTAATILDDAIEAVSTTRRWPKRISRAGSPIGVSAPTTEWFLRMTYPGVAPAIGAAPTLLADAGLQCLGTSDGNDSVCWVRTGAATRAAIERGSTEASQHAPN